jgi:3',5'-cyclic AMP phosphodiesterase CpdA
MDPQQMWQEIVDAAHEIDIDDADFCLNADDLVKLVEQIRDLNQWMVRGGFPPKGVYPTQEVEQDVINQEIRNEHPWDHFRR